MKQLLRLKTYKIQWNNKNEDSLRTNLNPLCGFTNETEVYQVKRDDGVIELVPNVEGFDIQEYIKGE